MQCAHLPRMPALFMTSRIWWKWQRLWLYFSRFSKFYFFKQARPQIVGESGRSDLKKIHHQLWVCDVPSLEIHFNFHLLRHTGALCTWNEFRLVWEAWDTTCGYKAKGITSSIAWRREAWKEEALDDLHWKDEREPSSIRRTLGPFERQCWWNLWETGWSAYGLFRAHRYHLEMDWTKLVSELSTLCVRVKINKRSFEPFCVLNSSR